MGGDMRRAILLTLLLATVPLLGCLEDAPPASDPGGDVGPSTAWAQASNGVNVTLEVTSTRITPGEDTGFTITARNDGDEGVEYRDGCAHEWDVKVLDPAGNEVDWMGPVAMCQGFQQATLDPGETDEGTFAWNGTVWNSEDECWSAADPGTYTVEGSFVYLQNDYKRYVTASLDVQVTEFSGDMAC